MALTGMVALAGPAAASHIICGQPVTADLTFDSPVGPCTGNGLVVTASNITIDMAGYSLTGNNTLNQTTNEQVGIILDHVQNVTVKNGTVQNFDAGVAILGGKANVVNRVLAQNNINHSSLTGKNNPCNYGDGITVQDSKQNIISNNRALHNGPFSGIALVGNSDNNLVTDNRAANQTVSNILPQNGGNGPCGPFSAQPSGVGRTHQDIGIRIEGPGANNNKVLANRTENNQLEGISIHGYVCWVGNGGVAPPGAPPVGVPNTGNLVQGNYVRHNGFADLATGEFLDGIGILRQGPFGNIVCASNSNKIIGNTVLQNAHDGIYVPPTGDPAIPANNTVSHNTVNENGRDGIHLDGPFSIGPPPGSPRPGSNDNTLVGNQGIDNGNNLPPGVNGHDGFDGNVACDNNFWKKNLFGTVNQACVAANGGTGTEIGPVPV